MKKILIFLFFTIVCLVAYSNNVVFKIAYVEYNNKTEKVFISEWHFIDKTQMIQITDVVGNVYLVHCSKVTLTTKL